MKEKIIAYCDINSIADAQEYCLLVDHIESNTYGHIVCWNTNDFLVQGIWDFLHHTIDEETFFLIGDVGSEYLIKQPRPHLDAIFEILKDKKPSTLYVVDAAAKITYEGSGNDWAKLQDEMREVGSHIYYIS